MSQGRDILMPEGGDAVSDSRNRKVRMRVSGVLERLPGKLVSRQVLLFSLLLGDEVGMCRAVL